MTDSILEAVNKVNEGTARSIRKVSEIVPSGSLSPEVIEEIWISQASTACEQLENIFGFDFDVLTFKVAYSAASHLRHHRDLSREEYMAETGEYIYYVGRELEDGFFLVTMEIYASPSIGKRTIHIYNSELTIGTDEFEEARQSYREDPEAHEGFWRSPNARYKPVKQTGYVQPLPDLRFLRMSMDEVVDTQRKMARQLLKFFEVEPQTEAEKVYVKNVWEARFIARKSTIYVQLPGGPIGFSENQFEFYQALNDNLPTLNQNIEITEAAKRFKWNNSFTAKALKQTKTFIWDVVTLPFWLTAVLASAAWELLTNFPGLIKAMKDEAAIQREVKNLSKYNKN